MIRNLLLALLLIMSAQLFSFPIDSFDYHVADNTVSPITAALGGMNTSNYQDPNCIYYNPGMLTEFKSGRMAIGFSMDPENDEGFNTLLKKSNLINNTKLNYFSIATNKGGFAYIPLANFEQDKVDTLLNKKIYQSYYMNAWVLAFADRRVAMDFGINLKFLQGRLVYFEEDFIEGIWQKNQFIDDSAMGFSFDLGFYKRNKNYSYGLVLYDILSHLYWDDHSNKPLTRRFAVGSQLTSTYGIITSGITGRLKKSMHRKYHIGYQRNFILNQRTMISRVGVYSKDFKNAENIYISFGLGLKIQKNFSIDMSITNNDGQIDNSKYLISFTLAADKGQ